MDESSGIQLTVPATSAQVALMRMTAAWVSARADFTLDDIEDLRMAVGEACALVLPGATGSMTLGITNAESGALKLTISADSASTDSAPVDDFGWQVLTTLADDVRLLANGTTRVVEFTSQSTLSR